MSHRTCVPHAVQPIDTETLQAAQWAVATAAQSIATDAPADAERLLSRAHTVVRMAEPNATTDAIAFELALLTARFGFQAGRIDILRVSLETMQNSSSNQYQIIRMNRFIEEMSTLAPEFSDRRIQVDEAEAELDSALEGLVNASLEDLDPANREFLYELGMSLLEMERYTDAGRVFERLLEVDDLRAAAAEGLVRSLLATGRIQEAYFTTRMAQRMSTRGPESQLAGLQFWQAVAADAAGKQEEARKLYRKVLEFDPDDREAQARLDALG